MVQETSLILIETGQLARLQSLLCPPELAPLRPLVVLVGWDKCADTATAADLLNTLWNPQVPDFVW